jgi:hypothetical protein
LRARPRGFKAGVIWQGVFVELVVCQKVLSVYEMGESISAKEGGRKDWLARTRISRT